MATTPSLEAMTCYDIHTHHPAADTPDCLAILNIIIGRDEETPASNQWHSVGIHPWYIYNGIDLDRQLTRVEQAAKHPGVVAIGEAGLDHMADTPPALQEETFIRQAALAEQLGKPLIIHCVKAWDELIQNKKTIRPHVPWVIHGFRGNGLLAEQLLRQDFFLSFGEHFNPQALQAAWPGKLFAETDESPIGIRAVYAQLAMALNQSPEAFATTLESNVHGVFL